MENSNETLGHHRQTFFIFYQKNTKPFHNDDIEWNGEIGIDSSVCSLAERPPSRSVFGSFGLSKLGKEKVAHVRQVPAERRERAKNDLD